jgi:uncharacterized protein (DUF983 family)
MLHVDAQPDFDRHSLPLPALRPGTSFADSGDGPAVFVIFLVAPLVIILALAVGSVIPMAPWVHLLVWIPATLLLCLVLLPPFKGVLVNLQFSNDAHEGHQ